MYKEGKVREGDVENIESNVIEDLADFGFEEEEDLLQWSEALDFDQYYSDWLGQSCSNGSEVR